MKKIFLSKQIFFRRFYYRMKEKDYGMAPNAIITFDKRPAAYETIEHKEGEKYVYRIERFVSEWYCGLAIELWICQIRLTWKQNAKKGSKIPGNS